MLNYRDYLPWQVLERLCDPALCTVAGFADDDAGAYFGFQGHDVQDISHENEMYFHQLIGAQDPEGVGQSLRDLTLKNNSEGDPITYAFYRTLGALYIVKIRLIKSKRGKNGLNAKLFFYRVNGQTALNKITHNRSSLKVYEYIWSNSQAYIVDVYHNDNLTENSNLFSCRIPQQSIGYFCYALGRLMQQNDLQTRKFYALHVEQYPSPVNQQSSVDTVRGFSHMTGLLADYLDIINSEPPQNILLLQNAVGQLLNCLCKVIVNPLFSSLKDTYAHRVGIAEAVLAAIHLSSQRNGVCWSNHVHLKMEELLTLVFGCIQEMSAEQDWADYDVLVLTCFICLGSEN